MSKPPTRKHSTWLREHGVHAIWKLQLMYVSCAHLPHGSSRDQLVDVPSSSHEKAIMNSEWHAEGPAVAMSGTPHSGGAASSLKQVDMLHSNNSVPFTG